MSPYSSASLGGEDLVALDVLADLLLVAVRVLRERLLEPLRMRMISVAWISMSDAWPWPPPSHRGLVDQHARVGQREALAGRAGGEQHRGGRGRLAEQTVWICGGCTASCRRSPSWP